ncbi:MAG: hypothetical protein ACLFSW_04610 [Halobacteriales archaeon]
MNKIAVVAVGVAVLLGVGVATAQDGNVTGDNAEANVTLSFGEEISVLVSAQQTEVRNTVENDAFGIAFESNGTQAVGERAVALEDHLEQLEERKQELERQREAGEVSEGRYRAKMAKLSFEAEGVNSSANVTLEKAKGLERAGEQGVNVEGIRRLKQNASNMTGPEVAEIARGIAGRPGEAPERAGPPEGFGGNRSDAGGPDGVSGSPGENMTDGNGMADGAGDNDTSSRDGEQEIGGETGGGDNVTDGDRGGAPVRGAR